MAADPQRRRTARVLFAIGIAVFVGLAIAAGIVGSVEYRHSGWTVTEGTVVGSLMQRSDSGGVSYAPRVTYSVDGREYSYQSYVYSSSERKEGSSVEVRYNPAHPSEVSLGSLVWVVVLLGGIGLFGWAVFVGIGVFVLRRPRREMPTLNANDLR